MWKHITALIFNCNDTLSETVMSDNLIKVRVIYKTLTGKRIRLMHTRAELPAKLKPASKRIMRWHLENRLYLMLKTLIADGKLPEPRHGVVDVNLQYELNGATAQASLYKPDVKSLRFETLSKYPEGVPEESVLVIPSKIRIKS